MDSCVPKMPSRPIDQDFRWLTLMMKMERGKYATPQVSRRIA
jgi:hypothetical protein